MINGQSTGALHIVEHLAPGGIETFVLDLLRTGEPHDRVFSLQGTPTNLAKSWPALGEFSDRIDGFGRKPGVRPGLIIDLARRLRELRPYAVFAHHIGPLIYGGIAARLARVPLLYYVEHDVWHYGNRRHRLLAMGCFRVLQPRVVAVSEHVRAALAKMMPGMQITVIPPGIATDRYTPDNKNDARNLLGLDPAWQIVGTVGRLVPVKAQDILLRAISRLPERVHCVIAGDGPELENLRSLADELGIALRTHFLGHRNDLWRVYPAFDVFCLPSEAEGLPRTVLEAQACGVPVVATNVGGVSEAICTKVGVLVPPANPIALAQALENVLSRSGPRQSPRDFVEEHLSLALASQQYRALAQS